MAEPLEYMQINNHKIDKIDNKLLSHSLIYSFGLVDLKTPKICIKINLANNFIQLSKYLISILILIIDKKNISF